MQKFLILTLLVLSSCSSSPPVTAKQTEKTEAFRGIMDRYFETFLQLNPLYASSIGDKRYDAELATGVSDEYRARSRAAMESALVEIRALGCGDLPDADRFSCLTFETDLDAGIALLNADLDYLMSFNQFASFFLDFAEIASGSSYVTFDTASDYRNFLSRMKKVPGVLRAAEEKMREGMKKSITVPRALAVKGVRQLKKILSAKIEESVFYKPLLKFPASMSKAEQDAIRPEYETAIRDEVYPAYRNLLKFVETTYLPRCRKTSGVSALRGGRDYYRALARYHTTTALDPDAIHEIGLKEVARIRAELEAVKKELGFRGSLPQFFTALRSNPALYPFRSADEVMNAYRDIHKKMLPGIEGLFRLTPKAGFEIREVEKFKADTAGEAYQNPSEDGSRPGIFWVPVPDPKKYSKKSMETLFLHEAIPGHHFQIALQQELDLPRYRRFNGNNAYVEGWGLYAESLGRELGLYQDPYSRIGNLEYAMHRALRLVVDTGIHWKGWSRERAIAYCLQNEPMGKDDIVAEIERYMAIPGQALSYKLGELKIQELRALARSRLKNHYRDPAFHDEILRDGPLPLSVLETKIRAWIGREISKRE